MHSHPCHAVEFVKDIRVSIMQADVAPCHVPLENGAENILRGNGEKCITEAQEIGHLPMRRTFLTSGGTSASTLGVDIPHLCCGSKRTQCSTLMGEDPLFEPNHGSWL